MLGCDLAAAAAVTNKCHGGVFGHGFQFIHELAVHGFCLRNAGTLALVIAANIDQYELIIIKLLFQIAHA